MITAKLRPHSPRSASLPTAKNESPWRVPPQAAWKTLAAGTLYFAPIAIYGAYLVTAQWRIARWPTTQARIIRFEPNVHPAAGGWHWYANPKVEFEYVVGGKHYRSTWLNPSPLNYQSRSQFLKDTAGLHMEAVTKCWFDAASPDVAYLVNTGITAGSLVILGVGLSLVSFFYWNAAVTRFGPRELHFDGHGMTPDESLLRMSRRFTKALTLSNCIVDKSVVDALNESRGLRWLRFENVLFERPINKIKCLPRLFELGVTRSAFDDDLGCLFQCERLAAIDLSYTHASDDALGTIGTCKRLRYINLECTRVSDEGMASISGLPKLAKLNVARTAISDRGLTQLAESTSINELDLSHTAITDAAEKILAKAWFKPLRLILVGTALSTDALKRLKERYWPAKVVW